MFEPLLSAPAAAGLATTAPDGRVGERARYVLKNGGGRAASELVDRLGAEAHRRELWEEAEADRVMLALREAMVNALYHGNLEVPSSLKEDDESAFYELVARRQAVDPYRGRRIFVTVNYAPDHVAYRIRDEGPGFDVSAQQEAAEGEDAWMLASGRGLILIRSFMDIVSHNATGNEITMIKGILKLP